MIRAGQAIEQLQFTPVRLDRISTALAELFSTPDREDHRYVRIGSSNLVMICSCQCRSCDQEQLINLLSYVQPGRFFVVCHGSAAGAIEAQISARCTRFNQHEHLCSEVVRLVVPTGQQEALPSIIWANTLSGRPAELFWNRSVVDLRLLELFLPLISRIILDSAELKNGNQLLRRLLASSLEVVDLQWLGLASWRQSFARIFSDPLLLDLVGRISRIKVTSRQGVAGEGLDPAYLITAWLLAALNCHKWCLQDGNLKCNRPDAGQFSLHFDKRRSCSDDAQVIVQIDTVEQDSITCSFAQDCVNAVALVAGKSKTFRNPFLRESVQQILQRFYLSGQGAAGYQGVLQTALALKDSQQYVAIPG